MYSWTPCLVRSDHQAKEIIMHVLFKQNFISSRREPQNGYTQHPTGGRAPELETGREPIYLKKHQHLRIDEACGWTVHAVAGTLWITQDGDMRDIVLEAGDSFILDRNRTAVLSPLNEAQVLLKRGGCRQAVPSRTSSRARPLRALSAISATAA
jgi:hypothetical protein